MADVNRYGFLVDRDVAKAADLLPRKRTHTTVEAGLSENADDDAIVKLAWERKWIIVTGNGDEFVARIRKFQRKTEKLDCHELSGLIILPSGFELQKRLLAKAGERLRFDGKRITWADVWSENYCVKLRKNSSPEITKFPKCHYCQKLQEK
jgi:hypothetical protein